MAINFNDYLKMTGLGESAPVTRRKKRNVKPGKFNPIAFAEAYSYAIQDGRRMRLSGIANQREASRIAARGEAGLEDAKQFIKDKSNQAWEFLKKLYEKVIKFFTETLRYLMSNERKIGKTIAKLKAALKTKKDKLTVPFITSETAAREMGSSESYYGYSRRTRGYGEGEKETNNGLKKELAATKTALQDANAETEKVTLEKENIERVLNERNEQLVNVLKMKDKRHAEDKAKLAERDAEIERLNEIIANRNSTPQEVAQAAQVVKAKEPELKQAAKEAVKAVEEIPSGTRMLIFGDVLSQAYDVAKTRIEGSTAQQSIEEGNDVVSDAISDFKEVTSKILSDGIETRSVDLDKGNYSELVNLLLKGLENIKAARTMKTFQDSINKLKKEKATLEKNRSKESKDEKNNESKTLSYQLRRGSLQGQIKLSNLYIGVNDKAIGKLLSYSGKVAAAA